MLGHSKATGISNCTFVCLNSILLCAHAQPKPRVLRASRERQRKLKRLGKSWDARRQTPLFFSCWYFFSPFVFYLFFSGSESRNNLDELSSCTGSAVLAIVWGVTSSSLCTHMERGSSPLNTSPSTSLQLIFWSPRMLLRR